MGGTMAIKWKCDYCKKNIDSSASRCPYCQGEYTPEQIANRQKAANSGRNFGCAALMVIIGVIYVIGSVSGPKSAALPDPVAIPNVPANSGYAGAAPAAAETEATSLLTPAQQNAARSAQQYINMTGFSRNGLIDQLSSSAGNGYDVADATVAVDSLNIDWKEQAVRSAKQYLQMTGFSCKGLIEQLSSSAGSKYTTSEARYGATQAGAC